MSTKSTVVSKQEFSNKHCIGLSWLQIKLTASGTMLKEKSTQLISLNTLSSMSESMMQIGVLGCSLVLYIVTWNVSEACPHSWIIYIYMYSFLASEVEIYVDQSKAPEVGGKFMTSPGYQVTRLLTRGIHDRTWL